MSGLTFVCLSDTHERHREIEVPAGDVLIVSGDVTANGSPRGLIDFAAWMEEQPHAHKILVAGNHDFIFQRDPQKAKSIMAQCAPSVTYLQDSGITIEGLNVWGSPWQPRFYDWAFNLNRGPELAAVWRLIPDDTDVLITHGPPFLILDRTPQGDNVGCEDLGARLMDLSVRLHVFGHIHHSHGIKEDGGRRISVNAAICDEGYRATHAPIVINLLLASPRGEG